MGDGDDLIAEKQFGHNMRVIDGRETKEEVDSRAEFQQSLARAERRYFRVRKPVL